jgi:hypothetical protein
MRTCRGSACPWTLKRQLSVSQSTVEGWGGECILTTTPHQFPTARQKRQFPNQRTGRIVNSSVVQGMDVEELLLELTQSNSAMEIPHACPSSRLRGT